MVADGREATGTSRKVLSDPNAYDSHPNFARKRGLLEEINRAAIEAELEAAEMRVAEEQMRSRLPIEGPVEPAPLPSPMLPPPMQPPPLPVPSP